MTLRVLLAGLAFTLAAHLAPAQTPQATHIRGTLASADGGTFTVTTREGPSAVIHLMDHGQVIAFKRTDIAAITPGSFIGTAAKPDANGGLAALEVVVFPPAARGSGEGHYDWDLAPGTSMTNANVDAEVESASGRELTLSYKGGSVKVTVPPEAPVVTPIPATLADLKPGAQVFVLGIANPDGSFRTPFVAVAKDGVPPPM